MNYWKNKRPIIHNRPLKLKKLGVSEEIVAKGTGLRIKRVLELNGKLN